MPNNTIQQINQFHSEWSRMEMGAKIGLIVSLQAELKARSNGLGKSRMPRGYFAQEEKVAIQHLQDIQKDLDQNKAEVCRIIRND